MEQEDMQTVNVPERRPDAVLLETGEFEVVRKLRSRILDQHAKMYPWVYITRVGYGDDVKYVLSVANGFGGKLSSSELEKIAASVSEELENLTLPS